MNPQELFLQDGRSSGVWFCGWCRTVSKSREIADKCCTPNKCRHCGKECEEHWLACKECLDAASKIKEHQRFTEADKVRNFDGAVFLEGCGHNDGYFDSVGSFVEWWEDEHGENEPLPKYVWACASHPSCHIVLERVIEDATQDAHDEYDASGLTGVEELRVALDKFNEQNKRDVTWTPNFNVAVLL